MYGLLEYRHFNKYRQWLFLMVLLVMLTIFEIEFEFYLYKRQRYFVFDKNGNVVEEQIA